MTAITWKITDQFFDRRAVTSAVERANMRCLSRAGSYVRRTARKSIKPAPKPRGRKPAGSTRRRGRPPRSKHSRPGEPPRLQMRHTNRNIKLILFAYRPSTQSVIVGPVKFNNRSGVNVPQILEHGGRTTIKTRKRVGKRLRKVKKTARIASRPFMMPALVKETPNFAKIWKNTVGKT